MITKSFPSNKFLTRPVASVIIIFLLSFLSLPVTGISQASGSANGKPPMPPLEFKQRLKGPILSFPTPFTENYEINYKGVSDMIKPALQFGCTVIALTSGNSKYDRLSYAEVRELTRFVLETVGDKAITIASTGAWDREYIKDYARYAEYLGASAVQVALPLDLAGSENIADIVAFYKEVAATTRLAIVLHGFFSVELLTELVKINSIVAMKEDVDYPYYITRQTMFKDRLAIFGGGNDGRYLHGYPYGSPAYYSTLYTYAPEMGLKFWQAIQNKDMKTAIDIILKYDLPVIEGFSFALWSAAIEYFGGPPRYIRPKNETLTEPELKKMRELFGKMGLSPSLKYPANVRRGISLPDGWGRGGHIGGLVEGKITVAGGNNWSKDKTSKLWLSDAAVFSNGQWVRGPALPKPVAYAMYAHDASGLYFAGGTEDGKSASRDVYRLRSVEAGKTWEPLPKLPFGIHSGAGAILNGKFYVCTGNTGKADTDKMFVLDLRESKGQWQECRPVPDGKRMLTSLVACGKYLYLMGGLSNGLSLTDAYRYDPDNNQWKKLNDLSIKGYAWVAESVDSNHLVLTGRADDSKPFSIHTGIWIVDVNDMSVRKSGELIEASTTAPLIRVKDKQWWFVGGEPDSNRNRTGVVSVIDLGKSPGE